VVPEVDFPAHCNAALSAYPELNESGVAAEPYTGAGVIAVPLWLDGPATLGFVSDVIAEVTAMTPGPWVHVGGDEAVDISDEDYAAFMPWLQGEVSAGGKTMIGWDEIGPVPLAAPFVAQHWFDEARAVAAVDGGGQMIASPAQHAYLDMVHDEFAEFGQFWAGAVGIRRAYLWDPVPAGVDEADVLGVEGALWTELVNNRTQVDFMAWPRSAGLAEVGWSATTDWDGYRARLGAHGARLEALGLGYYRSPEVEWTALAR
jgi:hexosaminidase